MKAGSPDTQKAYCLRIWVWMSVAPQPLVKSQTLESCCPLHKDLVHATRLIQHLLCAEPQVWGAQTLTGVDQHGMVALGSDRLGFKFSSPFNGFTRFNLLGQASIFSFVKEHNLAASWGLC